MDESIVKECSDRLAKLMRVEDEPKVSLRGLASIILRTSLQPQFWDAWKKFSGDPEPCIGKWAREGVPLGMAASIPSSNRVFPPAMDEAIDAYVPGLADQMACKTIHL